MTVIAWDGATLAADRRVESGGHIETMTKIARCPDGSLIGWAGFAMHGVRLVRWAMDGFDPLRFPVYPDGSKWASLYRILPDGRVLCYENHPEPLPLHDARIAAGTGGAYAMGAMAAGADARTAVEIACRYNCACGNGVDALDLVAELVP